MSSERFDEAACLCLVREGNESACRELVEHLYPAVIRIVRAHLPRREMEEDLDQEVFMKMFARLSQYRQNVPLQHWVSRINKTQTRCLCHKAKLSFTGRMRVPH